MFKRKLLVLAQVALLGSSAFAMDVPPETSIPLPLETQTRGWYNSFQDIYKFVSPSNAMLILPETLVNVRFKGRYGPHNPKFLCHYQITNPSDDHQPTSEVDSPQDQTSAIIQHFFPSPAGGILRTPALNKFDLIARIDINAIGKLLQIYVSYITQMEKTETASGIVPDKQEFFDKFEEFFDDRLKRLKQDKRAYNILLEQWEKAGVNLDNLPKIYATMFTDAFEERAYYPAHLIEYTLLAYAWKKTGNKGQILTLINESLKDFKDPKQVKKKVIPFSEQLYWQWKQEAVKNNKLIPWRFKEWVQDPEKLIFMTVGYSLFEDRYPKMLDSGIAVFSLSSTRKIQFPDCGETSLRNFFNFMISNSVDKKFDREILLKAFPGIKGEIIEFYTNTQPNYTNVLGIEKDKNAWADSISGLDPQKVGYRQPGCNIKGDGIDNMLSVLQEILGDDELKKIDLKSKEESRAKKLQYVIDKFNEARPDINVSWSQSGRSTKLSDFPSITFMVNGIPVFEWMFLPGHFNFHPIAKKNESVNWLLNSAVGFENILNSSLSDSLKRLLLPFYMGNVSKENYLSNHERKQRIKGYAYEFLFGNPMNGNEQILEVLDNALSLNSEDPSLQNLTKTLIRKSFTTDDRAGDRMLISFLFKYKSVFEDITSQDFGERVAKLYTQTLNYFNPQIIQTNPLFAASYFEELFTTPLSSKLIDYIINNWPKNSLKSLMTDQILHIASKHNHVSVMEVLLKNEQTHQICFSPDNIKKLKSNRTLHIASKYGHVSIVNVLLKDKLAREILLSPKHIKNKDDNTPLHIASKYGHVSIVNVLLKDKLAREILLSPEHIKDQDDNTPLHIASEAGHESVVEALLKDKLAREILLSHQYIRDRFDNTPLHIASEAGHESLVEALLKEEPAREILLSSEYIIDLYSNNAPLHIASKAGHVSVVEALLKDELARKILLSHEYIIDRYGNTPLHIASKYGHVSIVNVLLKDELARKILLSHEYIIDRYGNTPLHIASEAGHVSVVEALLKDELARKILLSPEHIKNKDDNTPLHIASKYGHVSIVNVLLKDELARKILLSLKYIKGLDNTPLWGRSLFRSNTRST
ncbi:MAG: ankyrin repeat domain-containing protein [Candidatus Paracaedibacteraceae bacterium]|nr:ankyrin repeat domain-containing protein [Candidatus Paracaedibacteraceae bacterium]